MLVLLVACTREGQPADVIEPEDAPEYDGAHSSSESGSDFLPPPDAGDPAWECDIWAHDCPAGEKCMPWANDGGSAWSATRCSPIAPEPARLGEPCHVEDSAVSGLDDCDFASMCWNVDPQTNEGVCVPMCVGQHPRCEDPNRYCAQAGGGALKICLPTCDPLLQDCREGQGCYGTPDSFVCAPTASSNGLDEPCEFYTVCSPGLQCLSIDGPPCPDGAVACCRPFCRIGDVESPCSALEECVPWYEDGDAPARWEEVGYCAVPDL